MNDRLFLISDDTPIAMLTVGQLKSVLESSLNERTVKQNEAMPEPKKRFEHGVSGIRRIFNCSYPTAHRLKQTILKPAIIQQGRLILVDVEMALKLFKEHEEVKSIKEINR